MYIFKKILFCKKLMFRKPTCGDMFTRNYIPASRSGQIKFSWQGIY